MLKATSNPASPDWWLMIRFLTFAFTEKGQLVDGAVAANPTVSSQVAQLLAAGLNTNSSDWSCIRVNVLKIHQDEFKPK